MMPEFTHRIWESILAKLADALTCGWGWLLGAAIAAANFFAGYRLAMTGILAAVAFDALFGIWVARRQGRFILSELLRATFFKLMVYLNLVVVFVFIYKFAGAGGLETRITTMLIASALCLAEAWSSCGNALIINPNFPLLRLLRRALTGEIARKLEIEPDEVENYLKQQ